MKMAEELRLSQPSQKLSQNRLLQTRPSFRDSHKDLIGSGRTRKNKKIKGTSPSEVPHFGTSTTKLPP